MNSTIPDIQLSGGDAVRLIAREQIVQRLRRAAGLLRRRPEATEQACALLTEALDRVRSLATLPAPEVGDASRFTVLSTSGGKPVGEFLLIPFGDVRVERPIAGESFAFTRQHAEAALGWFGRMGRKLAIDYEHQTFDALNTRPDRLRPAAGWIGGLEIRADGLWAVDVTWTDRAADLLRSGEYRYFSPVIFWGDEGREQLAGLGPVALTNDPAMRGVQALAAKSELAALGGAAGSAVRAPSVEPEPAPGAVGADAELADAQAEIHLLRERLAAQQAEGFIERGLRIGKITVATRDDWRADFLRNAEQAEDRLRRAPVVLPPGRIVDAAARGRDEPRAALDRGNTSSLTRCLAGAAIEPADLDAYERAAQAGFVRYAGRA